MEPREASTRSSQRVTRSELDAGEGLADAKRWGNQLKHLQLLT